MRARWSLMRAVRAIAATGVGLMLCTSETACVSIDVKGGLSGEALIKDVVFAAVDVETTGFSPVGDRIVEVGVVRFRGSVILSTNSWLINPGIPIPQAAFNVHGIDDSLVVKCRSFREVWPEVEASVGEDIVLMHNVVFDSRFLASETRRSGLEFWDNSMVDTLGLFRKWFPDARSHRLGVLAQGMGLEGGIRQHRALGDALLLQRVFVHGMREHPSTRVQDIVRYGRHE
jgi:DNA polymerase-3 subunit alpha (Gram-positive type)